LNKNLDVINLFQGGGFMKITINIDEKTEETEILINCNQLTGDIENIIATLRIMNQQMTVMRDDENYLLDVNNISYIEAVERKTFVYTEDAIYESKLKLYEMEDRLCQSGFFRVSKSCLVHLKFIKSLKNDIDRKLRLTMKNGEQIMVSRQYAEEIKSRLGVIK
jgi:DNA-binding LytR/AlgR family response regulator